SVVGPLSPPVFTHVMLTHTSVPSHAGAEALHGPPSLPIGFAALLEQPAATATARAPRALATIKDFLIMMPPSNWRPYLRRPFPKFSNYQPPPPPPPHMMGAIRKYPSSNDWKSEHALYAALASFLH